MKKLVRSLRYFVTGNSVELLMRAKLHAAWLRHSMAAKPAPAAGTPAVIVSLTSYPPRFPTLHLTLKSLLMQSYGNKKVILWIAEKDLPALPDSVTALRAHGLEINGCADIRSYKKLIPTLQKYGPVAVTTADDDIYYWSTWLQELVTLSQQGGGREIVCHRKHRMAHGADGLPLPYSQWQFEAPNTDAGIHNFPTGIGGVLYPAGIFTNQVLDQEAFMRLCPQGDDIWFYWMGRSNGATFRSVAQQRHLHTWRGSQASALWLTNVGEDRNDTQIRAMIAEYGYFDVVPAPAATSAA